MFAFDVLSGTGIKTTLDSEKIFELYVAFTWMRGKKFLGSGCFKGGREEGFDTYIDSDFYPGTTHLIEG